MAEPKHVGEIIGEILAKIKFPDANIQTSSETNMVVDGEGELINETKVKVVVIPKTEVKDITINITPSSENES